MRKHLNPEETALIIIDMQNDFCHEEGVSGKRNLGDIERFQAVVEPIAALTDKAREVGVPVIFVYMTLDKSTISPAWAHKFDGLSIVEKGSWGADFYKLYPQEGDYVVEKHRYSAFIGTNLDLILRSLNRKSIIVTGVVTNVCVESTARDGFMLDYNVAVVRDACAGSNPAAHQMTLDNIDAVFGITPTSSDVIEYWSKASAPAAV
jgi:ureidoacrylate peracid hydrolase